MDEVWTVDGAPVASGAVGETLRSRVQAGQRETWLSSSAGRALAFVTNTDRAMVMLLTAPGDAGEHAVDLAATGSSDGFVLSNGQDDEYPDADTVPLDEALRIAAHIVAKGTWPPDARWVADR